MNIETTEQERTFSPVLEEIWNTASAETPSGEHLKVVANVNRTNCNALYDHVVKEEPSVVIEVGMAYGISTLTILSALFKNGSGRLISIDPYIGWPTGMAVAKHQVCKAGFAEIHTHIQEASQTALPELWKQEFLADFIYLDGYHNVEYVMADCFFSDKLLPTGGVMAFNDCGWRAVFKVLKFLQRHRRYEELNVLPRSYQSRNLVFSLIKRIQGRSNTDRYFRKIEDWEPESGFYRDF